MKWYQYMFSFLIVSLLQVLLFSQMQIWGYVQPAFFLFFILMLPLNTSAAVRLLWAFALGFFVDVFSHGLGLHTAAILPMTFVQYHLIKVLKMPKEPDMSKCPNIREQGLSWFLLYTTILVFIYHLVFFALDAFSISLLIRHMYMVLVNSIVTVFVILIAHYFTTAKH